MSLRVLAAKAERTPLAQWMITGADLSVMRFSTELSSVPRGMWTAPGMAPCSYSSARDVEHRSAGPAAQLVGRGRVDLADLGLGGEQLTEARHRAPSGCAWRYVACGKPSDLDQQSGQAGCSSAGAALEGGG
jgi:hypothetical protein